MAVLSRSSLRGSVRRAPEEPADGLAPPTKKQRIQENGTDRRKSSPDCLDTTADEPPTVKPRTNPPVKPSRPRTSTRRTRRDSSSSVDTVASAAGQLATPATRTNGNGIFKTPRARRDPGTPSRTADLLRDLPESPDPLDTISPAPTSAAPKQRTVTPAANVDSHIKLPLLPVTRPTRDDTRSLASTNDEKVTKEELPAESPTSPQEHKTGVSDGEQPASVETRTGRRSLRSADTGSRCKSELAQYFHNYEQIISLEEPTPGQCFIPLGNELSS